MKNIVSLLLCAMMVIPLTIGCGRSSKAALSKSHDADKNGTYDFVRYACSNDPADLLPWNFNANAKPPVYNAIYDSLFDWTNGAYVPRAAKGFKEVDDLHTDVELYDYVTDWKGNNITSKDVVACYNRFTKSGYAKKFSYYKGIEAIGPYTVRFTWNSKPNEVSALDHVFANVPLYCDAEWSDKWAANPIGTGPYKVESFITGSKIVLVKTGKYWQKPELCNGWQQANVDKVEYDIIPESSQTVIGLQNHSIDFGYYIPNESYITLAKDENLSCLSLPSTDIWSLIPNAFKGKALSDVNMRKAVFYAIDNDAIAKAMAGTFACKAFGSKSSPDYVKALEDDKNYINTSDAAIAKEYLAKTSYKGEELVLMTSVSEQYKVAAQLMQVSLKNAGINCTIKSVDQTILDASLSNPDTWDLMIFGLGGTLVVDAADKLFNNATYKGKYCLGFINDPVLQQKFKTASAIATHSDATIKELSDYVVDNAYTYIFVGIDLRVVMTKNCVKPVTNMVYLFPTCSSYDLGTNK